MMSFVDILQNKVKEKWRQLLTTRPLPEPPKKGPPSKSQMKRLKQKLKNNRLQKSGCSSLYLFAHLQSGTFGYVMYKINYNHLDNTIEQLISDDKDKAKSEPLIPLLVFCHGDVSPVDFCSLVPLGDYLYFVGDQTTAVFTIRKSDIQNLTPNETNLGSRFLKPLNRPMNSPKYKPLVFVAKGNLYVISVFHHSSHGFEMYSPSSNTWTVLKYRPGGPYGPFKSHVVVDDNVYFATEALDPGDHDQSVFSYNLTNQSWKLLSTSPVDGFSYDLHPAFDAPVFLIGDMLFGGFSLPNRFFRNTVAASPYSNLIDSDPDARYFLMRPTLAPQQNFCLEFDRRNHYVVPDPSASYDMTYMQTSEGENVVSCVSYGYQPTSWDTVVFFNFFKIPRDPPVSLEDEPVHDLRSFYYATQVASGSARRSYFKSEFMHRKLFKISTNELLVCPGRLITCFSY